MYKRETDIQRAREKISVVYKLVSELEGLRLGSFYSLSQRDREKISVVYKLVSELVGYVWGRSTACPHT